jgi:hypothetical protein
LIVGHREDVGKGLLLDLRLDWLRGQIVLVQLDNVDGVYLLVEADFLLDVEEETSVREIFLRCPGLGVGLRGLASIR